MTHSAFIRGSDGRMPRLCYRADEWLIAWPCERCGGVELPLVGRPTTEVQDIGECPGCHARDRRSEPLHDPSVWWDPPASDWVVRVPCGRDASVVLPLDLPWFDAPAALVHCAAADVVYSCEAESL